MTHNLPPELDKTDNKHQQSTRGTGCFFKKDQILLWQPNCVYNEPTIKCYHVDCWMFYHSLSPTCTSYNYSLQLHGHASCTDCTGWWVNRSTGANTRPDFHYKVTIVSMKLRSWCDSQYHLLLLHSVFAKRLHTKPRDHKLCNIYRFCQ